MKPAKSRSPSFAAVSALLAMAVIALGQSAAWATTYYAKSGSIDPAATGSWTNGAGAAPANFTTSGDTFEWRSGSTDSQANTAWTLGASGSSVNLIVDAASILNRGNTTTAVWGTLTVNGTFQATRTSTASSTLNAKSDVAINNGGLIKIPSPITILGSLLVNSGGTLNASGEGSARSLTVSGAATVNGSVSATHATPCPLNFNSSLTIRTGGLVAGSSGSISVDGATTIYGTGRITGSGTNTFTGTVTINGIGTSTSGATTFGQNLTLGDGTNAASLALSGDSSVAGNFTVAANSTFSSAYALNVAGSTTVKGTLALGAGGSLNSTTNLWIAKGGNVDVSANSSYTVGSSTCLRASGIHGAPATIKGGATRVSLGSQPMTLNYTPVSFNGESTSPALTLSQGNLILSNAITVNIGGSTPLGAGTYTLISAPGGTISGTPTLLKTTGPGVDGLESRPATLDLTTPGQVKLVVPVAADAIPLTRPVGVNPATYGDSLTFRAVLSPDPGDGTTVTFKTNGAPLGAATTLSGVAELTVNNLLPSVDYFVTATAAGHSTGILADNPQVVVPKALTIVGVTAQSKSYDESRNAVLTGRLNSPEAMGTGTSGDGRPFIGDTLTLNLSGAFATLGPGTGIAVTATATLGGPSAGNYRLTQPTGLTADIAALSTGREDEPYWLPAQTYRTETLFTTNSINRNVMRGPTTVYNGNVYTVYFRQGDERTMVAKIPLDGSTPVIQPLCSNAGAYGAIADDDNHCAFVIAVDRAGYVHVSGGMHSAGQDVHWRSVSPEDISAFTCSLTSDMNVPAATGITGPNFQKDPLGQLFWHCNQGTRGLYSYDATTQLWTSLGAPNPQGEISFDYTPCRQYPTPIEETVLGKGGIVNKSKTAAWDSKGRMHIVVGLLNKDTFEAGSGFFATDIVYAYSDDGGRTVFKSDGTPIQFPISATDGAATQGEIVLREQDDPDYKWLSPWPSIAVDKADRPVITAVSYLTGNHFLRLEDGKWVDYPGFADGGSLSTDPSGVGVSFGKIDNQFSFKRFWNPKGNNFATIPLSDSALNFNKEYYRDTGELIWTTLSGSDINGTYTIYRTVFDRVSKVIGVDLQPATNSRGTMSGDVNGGFYTGLTNGTWNTLTGPENTSVTNATSQALVPMDGSATANPVKVILGGGAGESFKFATWPAVADALKGDGIQFDATNTASISILISGLIPDNRYDLALFGSAELFPTVTFNGTARQADGVFKYVSADTNGTILGSVALSGTNLNARLSGLQIQGIFAATPVNTDPIYYWDNNGTTVGFGTAGGTWGTDAFWTRMPDGSSPHSAVTATATDALVNFGNGAMGLAAGTITVGTAVSSNMTFASGSGKITLSGGTITLAGNATITVNNSSNTISSVLAGAATGLTKAGAGTLTLTGANTYTGITTINGGTLVANTIADTVGSSIGLGTAVSLANGTLRFSGATGTTARTFTLNTGGGTFNIDTGSSLSLSTAMARGANSLTATKMGGGTLTLVNDYLGGDASYSGTFAMQDGTLITKGLYFTVGQGSTHPGVFNQTGGTVNYNPTADPSLASLSIGMNSVGTLTVSGGTFNSTLATGTGSPGAACRLASNGSTYKGTLIVGGGSGPAVANITGGAIRVGLTAGSGEVDVLTNGTLQVNTLVNGTTTGTSTLLFDGGTLQAFTNTAAFVPSGFDSATIRSGGMTVDTHTHNVTIAQAFTQGTTTGGGLTKIGSGTLTLSGTNTYTGTTTIQDGTLVLGTNSAIPSSRPVILAGATLAAGGFTNTLGTLAVTGVATLDLGSSGSLSFSNSSAVAWTGTLALTGTLASATLRFGTSASALTAGQLARISINGHSVALTSNGYLVEVTGTYAIPISFYANADLSPGDQGVATFEALDLLDSDGDGVTNWQEYVAGTNPKNSNSVFRVTGITAKPDLTVKWIGGTRGPTIPYVVEAATSLGGTPGAWVDLSNHNGRVEGTNTFSSSKTNNLLFIRIRATQE